MVVAELTREQVLDWLRDVPDPEIPVVTIDDLGIVRDVELGDEVVVSLAPTYSGCPATEAIENSVLETLRRQGVDKVRIRRVLSPPWTTDWISDEGREKLRRYGIAPPEKNAGKRSLMDALRVVSCPRCESTQTSLVSEFGSTACKASYKCDACLEPFEYFKCI
ncbi:MAG: 1,2-phenylacetyl-CoA epoxidase subunit PaaD [Woeseiaceae bacterium]|nr:1,2-phenylacetyl-CoA epoxidase subunit PaaD [Woeseiaceae bacterium]